MENKEADLPIFSNLTRRGWVDVRLKVTDPEKAAHALAKSLFGKEPSDRTILEGIEMETIYFEGAHGTANAFLVELRQLVEKHGISL